MSAKLLQTLVEMAAMFRGLTTAQRIQHLLAYQRAQDAIKEALLETTGFESELAKAVRVAA